MIGKYLLLFFSFTLYSCEIYFVNNRDLSLSGKYVVTSIDVTNVDQSTERDSLYTLGSTFINRDYMAKPFDSIVMNRFYLHLDYSTIRINLLGTDVYGRDIWEYGNSPNEIFYQVWGNNAFSYGYLRFSYDTKQNEHRTMLFLIEEDGLETLQLKSSGTWLRGKEGQKQVMTLRLTRVGP